MIQNILREILEQNLKTCSYTFNEIKEENLSYRLNNKTATVGFIYRHIGEIMLLYGNFLESPRGYRTQPWVNKTKVKVKI